MEDQQQPHPVDLMQVNGAQTLQSNTAAESRATHKQPASGFANFVVPLNQMELLDDIYSGGAPSPPPVKHVVIEEVPRVSPVKAVAQAPKHQPPPITYVPAPKFAQSPIVASKVPEPAVEVQAPVIEHKSPAKVADDVPMQASEPQQPSTTQQQPPQMPASQKAAVEEESSHFSESSAAEDVKKPVATAEDKAKQKEELKRKLEALKAKLQKAKSVQEKSKLLEKERDKEIQRAKRKAEAKAELKQKQADRKSDAADKLEMPRVPKAPKEIKKSQDTAKTQAPKPKRERDTSTPVKKVAPKNPAASKPNQQASLDANAPEETLDYANKLHLVDELAKRWWYAMPQWPPLDFDYEQELAKRSMELVESQKLREPSTLKRVCQVEAYPGIYKDAEGKLHDLRPQESMPSLQNFQKKSVQDLQELLHKAYSAQQAQIVDMLEGRLPNYDRETEQDINISLGKKLKRMQRFM